MENLGISEEKISMTPKDTLMTDSTISEKDVTGEFERSTNMFSLNIFAVQKRNEPQKFCAVISQKDEKGNITNRIVLDKEEEILNKVIETSPNDSGLVDDSARLVDIKDEGLIISTNDSYIIVPQVGPFNVT